MLNSIPSAITLSCALALAFNSGGPRTAPVDPPTTEAEASTPPSSAPSSGPTAPGSTTSTAAPAGTDITAVTPIVVELLARYDAAVSAILTDPTVAADDTNVTVMDYLALFTPENEFASGVLAFWAAEGEAGRTYRAGASGVLLSTVVESVEAVSADEVTATVCIVSSFEVVDESGAVVEASAGRAPGSVTAVRTEGVWLLRDLTQDDARACAPPPTTTIAESTLVESSEAPASTGALGAGLWVE